MRNILGRLGNVFVSDRRISVLSESGKDLDWRELWSRLAVLLGGVFIMLMALAGVWALRTIPRWQVDELAPLVLKHDAVRQFELENEARKTLSQVVLGAFGLIALFFTWRRVRAGDRNVRVIEQGHITDRYESNRAIRKTDIYFL